MVLRGQVAVITGASSGIGRALAVALGRRGMHLVLGARSQAGLAETVQLLQPCDVQVHALPLDLTKAASVAGFAAEVRRLAPRVGVLVNNAGVGMFENTLETDANTSEHLFRTNVWGPLELTRLLRPALAGGTLVSVSSAAGRYAPMHQGIYAASKAALDRLTEAIALESPVLRTLLVIADRTATPFMQHATGDAAKIRLGMNLRPATPEHVAERIARALDRDTPICYTTLRARLYAVLSVLAPGLLRRAILRASR